VTISVLSAERVPHLLQLLLLLALIVSAAKLAGAAANRIGQPAVFGEILAGVILGPTALNVLGWPPFAEAGGPGPSHAALGDIIHDLAELGVILLMFVAGLETELDEMRRVGRVAFWSAAGGVALPLAGGTLTAVAFGLPLFWESIFIGTILTATSVSISAQTLMELGALRTREGSTILGAAVIDDVMGILLLSVVVAFARATGEVHFTDLVIIAFRIVLFFTLAIAGGRSFERVLAMADRLGASQGLLAMVLVLAFLYAWAAEYVGEIAAITGSYLAGVMVTRTSYKVRIDAGVHPLTYSMFVPVFFISIGLRANGRELGPHAAFALTLILVAIVTKLVGAGLLARIFGFTTRESVRVGIGMISRGEVGLIVAGYGLSNAIITPDVFSASIVMVLVTTMVTPPLLRMVFPAAAPRPRVPIEETVGSTPQETDGY
jgi:Kef-type K+ transport system membrane component KefB